MHEFQPHDGRPLSCMIFTDNQTSQDKELPMWRFLITGADYNREIKVWCTVTWTCLQTIRFSSPDIPGSSSIRSYLKVGMDLSASYLVISDVLKKVIYVLMFHQNFDEGQAHVTSVAKFHLTHPLLSFIVGQVKLFKLKSQGDQNGQENAESHDHGDDDIHSSHVGLDEIAAGEEKGKKYGVQLQLFCIQTRSMQELLVHFQPEPSIPPPTPSTLSSLTTVAGQSVIHDGLSDLSGMETGTEASTDVEEPEESTDGPVPVRTKLLTPQAFASTALQGSTHPEAVNSSNGSSITMISGLNNSQASVDELLGSSVSSRLSDTTVRSSNSATPQGSLAHESGILTPTTLPLPQSPVTPTSNPSAIPILNFQSSPQMASVQNTQSPASSFEPLVAISNTETQASPFALRDKAENVLSDSKSPSANEQNRSHSPGSMERNIEVSVDDDTRDGGDEELPESQKPEAETLEEENERERKSSSGSSTSESLRPLSARAEGNLICLEDDKRGEEDDVQVDGEDAFTEEGLLEQWDMNGDDGVVPTGRESPESAHALPVGTPTGYSEIGKRPSALSSFVSTPVSTTDLPPQQVQVTMDGGLSSSLEELLSLLKAQQQDIYDLRKQLKTYQSDQQQKMITVVNEVHQVEERVSSKLQNALAEFSREESQRLDKALRDKHSGDKKRHEQLQSTLSQTITTTLSGKLDKSVKAEIKSAVVPSVQKVLSAVQEQLNTTLGQKLTAADTVLKDSVAKIVKSKGVVDAIGTAAASALQGPIQVTYREAFQSTILPSFERACQNMFQQINESFHKGTQQYLQQVTTALDNRKREEKDFFQPVMRQLESQKQSFQATTERLSSNLMADFEVMIQKQLSSSIEGLREEIFSRLLSEVLASVQDSVQKEMGLGLEGLRQQLSEMITSSAQNTSQQSPSTAQTQAAVSRLLESGKVGEAFQEALTAGDLNIVMYVCENVDPEKVFSQSPCPLSQPVLLSLIQQLSVDLAMYTDLKHKYIEEALMALDARDAITREHMPGVLEGLCQQLQTTINEASGPMQRSLKMLLMAARSLIR
ncbi:hypothetical protein pdam_00004685 [Pocillopora damicornis]|uniref:Uncharacterized protein n=2 Tax=Pocillopora damicornis TaxID=46731 RepID=A0A3M6UCA1_POCDA|nr:hypothetical protein pdam_00004685 [Pocillopora damicornis]